MPKAINFIWIEDKGYWQVRSLNFNNEFGSASGHWVSFNDVVWC